MAYALEVPDRGTQLLICDEILDTIFGLLEKDRLIQVVENCRGKIELVMTRRNTPLELIRSPDYATELVQIKHPYHSGASVREEVSISLMLVSDAAITIILNGKTISLHYSLHAYCSFVFI